MLTSTVKDVAHWFVVMAICLIPFDSQFALSYGAESVERPTPEALAARVKEIFRVRCFECHGGTSSEAGIEILNHKLLVQEKQKVVAGRAGDSPLAQLVMAQDGQKMPPDGEPRLAADDILTILRWINAGAPRFPDDVASPKEPAQDPSLKGIVGAEYVLSQILGHVRSLPADDVTFIRYFSINHLLTGGATRDELNLHQDALVKAVNHLSLEPRLAKLIVVDDPTATVFAFDIRHLGWDKARLYSEDKQISLNLFDLAMLEYPYGAIYEDSLTYERLVTEYLIPAKLARPVPFVRVDWFVSVATQPPLYTDFLKFPHDLEEFEQRLGVDTVANLRDRVAKRAGMPVSGVSRNNRVVEWHPFRHGAYWKSFDFSSSKGSQNMFLDPLNLHPAGGEMIFNLPNGLQGYYIAAGNGARVDFAPTDIVTDKFAEDKTVRNGLACMRCHDQGMKGFIDKVRPAVEKLPGSPGFSKRGVLETYPLQSEMDGHLRSSERQFMQAMEQAIGHKQIIEPLAPVSRRFIDAPLQLHSASAELGLADPVGLTNIFRTPRFASAGLIALGARDGVVRRDMWEDYYHQVAQDLGLAIPVINIDSITRGDFPPGRPPLEVELKTNRKNNTFAPSDEAIIEVTNSSPVEIVIELIGTSARGEKVILVPAGQRVAAGKTFSFPPSGGLKVRGGLGKEHITLFAAKSHFPAGRLMRGKDLSDRVFHSWYSLERRDGRMIPTFDPNQIVKRTIDLETK